MEKSRFETQLDEILEGKMFQDELAKDYLSTRIFEDDQLQKMSKQSLIQLLTKAFVTICIVEQEKVDLIKENTDINVKLNVRENKNIEHLEGNINLTRKIKVFKVALPIFKELCKKEARSENSSNAGRKRAENDSRTQTLKKIAEVEYHPRKRMLSIRGHTIKFITDMHAKYPELARSSIEYLVSKLNIENGISQKKRK